MTPAIEITATPSVLNSRATIVSMAILAIATSALLHEGLGHGLTAYLRGDIPIMVTSSHLDDIRPDRLVDAAGTLVNIAAGILAMLASNLAGRRANLRYFLWLLGSFNLMDAAGYFLFSGIIGVGDWQAVIAGLPHPIALHILMSLFGAVFYFLVVALMARLIKPFVPHPATYNTIGRLPYYSACIFYCFAGAFDPLGIKLLFLSTIPAAFGGLSGLMWADSCLPTTTSVPTLVVTRQPAWWVAATILGVAFILMLGRGIPLSH
jgi:hypothetical protein